MAFISTSKGLYAFDLNSTSTQTKVKWVYPTELPLGHSPTVVTVNGKLIAYVGGYDRKIHAIDTTNIVNGIAQTLSGYTPHEAGAGFETNPLVIDVNGAPTIFAGNRDGKFYALDAVTGEKRWEYQTGGPILFSAAYKNNTLYFASNDLYAYALNATTGELIWKSEKLPGAGFHSYWPVIYTEKQTGKDYVIFGGGDNNRSSEIQQEHFIEAYYVLPDCGPNPPTNLCNNKPDDPLDPPDPLAYPISTASATDTFWASGTYLFDASKALTYFETYPQRRTSFILDASTGSEYTFDSDGDGNPEYSPFTLTNVTQSGNRYPAIVGIDGILYSTNTYAPSPFIPRGDLVGWKFGSSFISRVTNSHAIDEPMTFSSGGKLVYWSLMGERNTGAFDITIPYGQSNRSWVYYDSGGSNITGKAPDYDPVYNDGDPVHYSDGNASWRVYSGKNQSKNGVYGKHGTTQSPPIPYNGKVYILGGNTLMVWKPGTATAPVKLSLAQTVTVNPSSPATPPTSDQLKQTLEGEIQKIISSAPLRPGYHSSALYDQFLAFGYNATEGMGELLDYFQNPSDTVYTLLLAYPYLSSTTQQQVKTYLQNNYGPGTTYDITRIVHVGWSGAGRELFEIPPEDFAVFGTQYESPLNPSDKPIRTGKSYWQNFPPFSFYAAWKYAQIVGNNDQSTALSIFNAMSAKLEIPPSEPYLEDRPYILNLYIAGYKGYLELERLARLPETASVRATYDRLLSLRAGSFNKDTPLAWQSNSNPAYAVDNNAQTNWVSGMGGNQWLKVDLGTTMALGRVKVTWGRSFPNNYRIETCDSSICWSSKEDIDWTPISSNLNGNYDYDFGGSHSGRYIRVRVLSGINPAYYQLTSLEVYPNGQTIDASYGKPARASGSQGGGGTAAFNYNNPLAVARNFMFLTPELGDYLNQNALAKVSEAMNEYQYIAPYWFVPKFDNTYGEGTLQHLYDYPSLFQAKAWILKEPQQELAKYLDVPAFERGDLFYIQNLVAIIEASTTTNSSDINGDGSINADDALILFNNWFNPATSSADIYSDNKVNGIDFSYLKRDWKP
jgi:hypothetical protein